MRSSHLIGSAMGLGFVAMACDLPPDENAAAGRPPANVDPMASVGLDEADQVPNLLAVLTTGTSTVMFAEPAPGALMILEKARGKSAMSPNIKDVRQLWKSLAPERQMPLALEEAVDRHGQTQKRSFQAATSESSAGGRPARPSLADRGKQLDEMARDLRRNTEEMARLERQLDGVAKTPPIIADTGCGDQQHFINHFCSNWMYPANKEEACKLNKIWNGNPASDATFGTWNDAEYAFAAVCGLTGEFDFVVQHRTWWTWGNACDLNVTEGIHWNIRLWDNNADFDFRYIFQRAGGDTYHRMHFVDSDWFDPSGLGHHTIPPS